MLGVAAGGAREPLIFAARALASDSTETAVDSAVDGLVLTASEGTTAVLDPDVRTSLPPGLCTDAAAWGCAVLLALPFVLQATSTLSDATSSSKAQDSLRARCIVSCRQPAHLAVPWAAPLAHFYYPSAGRSTDSICMIMCESVTHIDRAYLC